MPIIREARLSDAERISEIYAYYIENTAISFEYESPGPDEMRRRIEKTLKRYPYLVAEVDGRVIGYCYAGPFKERRAYDWACELTIYLDHEVHGRGIGRQLYEALENALKERGMLNLYACIAYPSKEDEYLTTNSADFHAHLGFTRAGYFRQCGKKFDRWYDMVWMEKIIGEHV